MVKVPLKFHFWYPNRNPNQLLPQLTWMTQSSQQHLATSEHHNDHPTDRFGLHSNLWSPGLLLNHPLQKIWQPGQSSSEIDTYHSNSLAQLKMIFDRLMDQNHWFRQFTAKQGDLQMIIPKYAKLWSLDTTHRNRIHPSHIGGGADLYFLDLPIKDDDFP